MAVVIVGLVMYLTINNVLGCEFKEQPYKRIGIINGQPGAITKYPYMARYKHVHNTTHYQMSCGAVIISERYLLTAAHCAVIRFQVDDDSEKRIVNVGADNVEDGVNYEIEKTIIHPYYVMFSNIKQDYDIAVIKLKTNLTFSKRVRPIEMAKEDLELKSGDVLTAMGFGPINFREQPTQLTTINLSYVDHPTCRKAFAKLDRPISRRMLCARSSTKGSCYGDDGSPIIYNGTLVGVTSGGNPYCWVSCVNLLGTVPGLYTRISKFRDFIQAAMDHH